MAGRCRARRDRGVGRAHRSASRCQSLAGGHRAGSDAAFGKRLADVRRAGRVGLAARVTPQNRALRRVGRARRPPSKAWVSPKGGSDWRGFALHCPSSRVIVGATLVVARPRVTYGARLTNTGDHKGRPYGAPRLPSNKSRSTLMARASLGASASRPRPKGERSLADAEGAEDVAQEFVGGGDADDAAQGFVG